jgi:hypothetical protein
LAPFVTANETNVVKQGFPPARLKSTPAIRRLMRIKVFTNSTNLNGYSNLFGRAKVLMTVMALFGNGNFFPRMPQGRHDSISPATSLAPADQSTTIGTTSSAWPKSESTRPFDA